MDEAILLDTHALLWWATGNRSLSAKIKRLIQNDRTAVFVSAASAWEIATKARLGKLTWRRPEAATASARTGTGSIETYCRSQRFELLPVTFAHGELAGSWPQAHGDPFDRMLAAQSQIEDLPLATNDPKLGEFGIRILW